MYKGHKIAVVVPAFNEEELILETLDGMPDFVDRVFVVEDCSTDGTLNLLRERSKTDTRVEIIAHDRNRGLGQSLIDGYRGKPASVVDLHLAEHRAKQLQASQVAAVIDAAGHRCRVHASEDALATDVKSPWSDVRVVK